MVRKKLFIILFVLLEIIAITFGIISITNQEKFLGILLLIISFIMFLVVVIGYNKMIKYRNKISEALALIDIQLKLRFDLVPNLVKIVKKYSEHEKELFTSVTKLRKLATEAKDEKDKLEYANKLVPQLKTLVAVAEGYPEIKASAVYKSLMTQMEDVEDRLVAARRIYDSNVNAYNTLISLFPRNILAYFFKFEKAELFKIDVSESSPINIG